RRESTFFCGFLPRNNAGALSILQKFKIEIAPKCLIAHFHTLLIMMILPKRITSPALPKDD
ncbi:hypothetical protein ABTL25_19565, partial [Acinetobacter baumannii]